MVQLKDFSEWVEYEGASEGSGRSEKIWLKNTMTNEVGLFKFTKSSETKEHISEKIAEQIADLIGLQCAHIDIGTYCGREGCMSYQINGKGEILTEGISFINRLHPSYDPERLFDLQKEEYYSLEMILNSIEKYNLQDEFLKIVVFDFIIGNTDRHQNNWAVLQKENSLRMCPLYDNGSSLCCYIGEEQILSYLGRDKVRFRSLVDTKSRSRIRIDKTKKKEPSHLEMIQYIKKQFSNDRLENWISKVVVPVLNDRNVKNILMEYEESLLSSQRKKLLEKYILEKIHLLSRVFGKEEEMG